MQRVAESQGLQWYLIGAAARDLRLLLDVDRLPTRATYDLDVAVDLESWDGFEALRRALLSEEAARETGLPHRVRLGEDLDLDVVPFGSIAEPGGLLRWPGAQGMEFSTLGLREAARHADRVELPEGRSVLLPRSEHLLLLKLFAWRDRNARRYLVDAGDVAEYLSALADSRNTLGLLATHPKSLARQAYDEELAAIDSVGSDLAAILEPRTRSGAIELLRAQTDSSGPLLLPKELRLPRSHALLVALLDGIRSRSTGD